MCSEIDARTRQNPEAAMLSAQTADERMKEWREGKAGGNQVPTLHPEMIDSDAHRAFMRSLG